MRIGPPSLSLASELVDHIVDSLSDDPSALSKCTLISKQWLVRARYHHFNDTHIQLCEYHWEPRRCSRKCKRCITQFVLLVSSRHTTIPCVIRSLKLGGGTGWRSSHWMNIFKLVANAGGMENQWMVEAVFKHFRSVERLEFADVHWFEPSWRCSRAINHCISSVKTLVLNDIQVYIGPRAIFMMLDKMPNLEHLSMHKIGWPAKSGMPNNASKLLVFMINISILPFFRPLTTFSLYLSKLGGKTHRRVSHYALRKPLESLSLHVPTSEVEEVFMDWMLPQVSVLSSVQTLTAYTIVHMGDVTVKSTNLQRLLTVASPSLLHLRLHLDSYSTHAVVSPHVFPVLPALKSLSIHINDFFHSVPHVWIPWTWSIIRATPATVNVLRLALDLNMDHLEFLHPTTRPCAEASFPDIKLGDIDHHLAADTRESGKSGTRAPLQFHISVRTVGGWELPQGRLNASAVEQLVRKTFWRCEARNMLSVKVGVNPYTKTPWTWE